MEKLPKMVLHPELIKITQDGQLNLTVFNGENNWELKKKYKNMLEKWPVGKKVREKRLYNNIPILNIYKLFQN